MLIIRLPINVNKDVLEFDKSSLIPKNLFNVNESLKLPAKEEQKVKMIDGKKRITPILISPKKNFKFVTDKKSIKRSLSPEIEIVAKEAKLPEVTIV